MWVISGSRGSEAALLVAADFPGLLHGVMAYSPSAFGYPATTSLTTSAWTLHGQPLPYAAIDTQATVIGADGIPILRPALEDALGAPGNQAARIPVENIRGPVMLITGGADELWPSGAYADHIMAELDAARDPSPHMHHDYPAVGHLVFGAPYLPGAGATSLEQNGRHIAVGGSVETNNQAHLANWPAVLDSLAPTDTCWWIARVPTYCPIPRSQSFGICPGWVRTKIVEAERNWPGAPRRPWGAGFRRSDRDEALH